MRRPLLPLALAAALLTAACQNPDGSLNVPGTLALGAGAVIAGIALSQPSSRSSGYRGRQGGHWGGYNHGYNRGYGRQHGYRSW
jgi:hypothetical protein